jgi:anti-anti-sigma factor
MDYKLSENQNEHVLVIFLQGNMHTWEQEKIQKMEQLLNQVQCKRNYRILLDMSDVEFIDSNGLGQIIQLRNLVFDRNGSFQIVKASPAVHNMIISVNLADYLDYHSARPGTA